MLLNELIHWEVLLCSDDKSCGWNKHIPNEIKSCGYQVSLFTAQDTLG